MAETARNDGPSLLLRSTCRHCHRLLHLPLRLLIGATHPCPHCLSDLDVPADWHQVDGAHVVLRSATNGSLRQIPCPGCEKPLEISVADAGKNFRCISCHCWLSLRLMGDHPSHAAQSSNGSGGQPSRGTEASQSTHRNSPFAPPPRQNDFDDILAGAPAYHPEPQTAHRPDSPPEPVRSTWPTEGESMFVDLEDSDPRNDLNHARNAPPPLDSARPAGDSTGHPAYPLIDDDDPDPPEEEYADVPPIIEDGGYTYLSHRRHNRRGLTLFTSPRRAFWVIYLIVQFGPLFFGMFGAAVTGAWSFFGPIVGMGGMWIFPFWWVCRWFTWRMLVPLFVSSIRCPHCHEEYPAVSRWSCSCGYTDYRDRHILRFKCPKCRHGMQYLDCERCDATIILRGWF